MKCVKCMSSEIDSNKPQSGFAHRPFVFVLRLLTLMFLLLLSQRAEALALYDRVQATTTVTVRYDPVGGVIGGVIVNKSAGSRGIISNGPINATLNGVLRTWWEVSWDDGVVGWSVPEVLQTIPAWFLDLYSSSPNSGVSI